MSCVLETNSSDWKDFNEMLTCGQLVISSDLNCYAFKCNFCEIICLRLKAFIEHILEKHTVSIHELYKIKNELHESSNIEQLQQLAKFNNGNGTIVYDTNETKMCGNIFCNTVVNDASNPSEVNSSNNFPALIDNSTHFEFIEEDFLQDDENEDLEELFPECSSTNGDDCEQKSTDEINLNDINNRPLLSCIIQFFKENRCLWDVNDVLYSRVRHKGSLLHELVHKIAQEFKINIAPQAIRRIFLDLRYLYYDEFKRRDEKRFDISMVCNDNRFWCYRKMSFLNAEEVQDALLNKENPSITEDMKLIVAEILKQHRALWNVHDPTFHDRPYKEATLKVMLKHVNDKLGYEITAADLNLCINRLRRYYNANTRARINSIIHQRTFKTPFPEYVEVLDFLNGHVGPFFCIKCKTISVSYEQHVEHLNKHIGRKSCICEYCGKHLKNLANLKVHRRIHTREMPYECSHCGRKFTNSGSLKIHDRLHTGLRPYMCDVCGKTFRTCAFLVRHRLCHNPEKLRFKCSYCSKSFSEKQRLHEHENVHQNYREFVCDSCGKAFFARKTLRQHKVLHKETKSNECEICKKTFAQKAGLHSHMRRIHKKLRLNANDENGKK